MSTAQAVLYSGSVKDILGTPQSPHVTFKFTDHFSVFDWGRMPDTIEDKGTALAQLAAHLFLELQDPKAWARFSATDTALKLRHANHLGADFIDVGEKLQKTGLKTHFRRLLDARSIEVQKVGVAFPKAGRAFGTDQYDYRAHLALPNPKLVPLEVVFRHACLAESSILSRSPEYLKSIGVREPVKARSRFDFPIVELFTKLEPTDRCLSFAEALVLSGLSIAQFDEMLSQTLWIAAFLKEKATRGGLDLIDGKVEWGLDAKGELMLVDAVGPDEMRLEAGGVPLSKEFLRRFYRQTPWFKLWNESFNAKVSGDPPALGQNEKRLASELYKVLANQLSGQKIFDAWSLEKLVGELKTVESSR